MASEKQIKAFLESIKDDAYCDQALEGHQLIDGWINLGKAIDAAISAEPQAAAVKVKPLDLGTALRHAFMTGAGYGNLENISDADQERWLEYDPQGPCFKRLENAMDYLSGLSTLLPDTGEVKRETSRNSAHVNSGPFRVITTDEWDALGGTRNPECDWHEGIGYVVYDEKARDQYRAALEGRTDG